MADEPIVITSDDLTSKQVDKRLAEQEALARNREQSAMSVEQAEKIQADSPKPSIWYNASFTLTVFGLIGGLLAWIAGEAVLRMRPTAYEESRQYIASIQEINSLLKSSRISATEAQKSITTIQYMGGDNEYLLLEMNDKISASDRESAIASLRQQDERKVFILNTISYGLCGLLIALALAIAEPVVDRNIPRTIMSGTVGMTLGLAGGIAASLFLDKLYGQIVGENAGANLQLVGRAVTWGLMGLIISAAPGLVMRNGRRLLIGMIGGALGGIVGGALWDTVGNFFEYPLLGRLVALCAIGGLAGLLTGLIEAAAKSGWIRVTQGFIAGKQFVIYRNPTYIGAGPECQIYLFKDPKIGRRHAAVHIVTGGFEIEDLPLGERTIVNDQPIVRQRLRHGDKIRIGGTQLVFQEKVKGA